MAYYNIFSSLLCNICLLILVITFCFYNEYYENIKNIFLLVWILMIN